jgi:CDP-paratose 2-epimerase
MPVAVITGSGGLIGAETVKLFADRGLDIVGIDNDMRARFFGAEASTCWQVEVLKQAYRNYVHVDGDVRDEAAIRQIFAKYRHNIAVIVHCAAQPSHDWAAREPITDFTINANGTLNLLEATRQHAPDAVFIFVSTNKVYGDRPNHLPFVELETRFELAPEHPWAEHWHSGRHVHRLLLAAYLEHRRSPANAFAGSATRAGNDACTRHYPPEGIDSTSTPL